MRLVLDSEMQRMTGGLQVLALTNSLRNDDFDELPPHRDRLPRPVWQGRRRAGLRPQRPAVVLLGDEDTASLPPRNNREIVEKVFATKSPQYSDLFTGAINSGRSSPSRFRCSATAR